MHKIDVSIVYAERDQQWVYETAVNRGTVANELLSESGFLSQVPALIGRSADSLEFANYAQRIPNDYLLENGDRIEVLRELTADPKEVRRQLAKLGKTMGKKPK